MVSEAERAKTMRFYRSSNFITEKHTQFLIIGTRKSLLDVYSFIEKEIPSENIMVRKAILTEDGEGYDKGRALCPEINDMKNLMRMYHEDPVIFESEMQNNPTAFDDQLYALEKLRLFDMQAVTEDGHHIAYVDPAFGKNNKGEPCFFSLIIGKQIGDNVYIVEWLTNRRQPQENEALIIEKIQQYKLNRLGIESNAQQTEFIRNVKRGIDEFNAAHMQPEDKIILGIEYVNHTQNKDRRIQSIHGTVIDKFQFRQDWSNSYNEGMTQLILYPHHKFKDAPDALAGLVEMVQNAVRAFGEDDTFKGGGKRR
jgi:predicted phage terminase large subunit-like protein